MTRIIIIPLTDQNYNPLDFELSVKRLKESSDADKKESSDADKSYKDYKTFNLNKDLTLNIDLQKKDILGVNYRNVPQIINPHDQGSEAVYTVVDPLLDITLNLGGSAFSLGKNPGTIENDLNVNLKSFNPTHPLEIKLTPSVGGPTKDQSFWNVINSNQLDFRHYRNFIDEILSFNPKNTDTSSSSSTTSFNAKNSGLKKPLPFDYTTHERKTDIKRLPFNRTEAYSLLKFATEKYVERVYGLKNFLEEDYDEGKFELEDYVGKDKIIPYYDLVKSKIKEYFIRDQGEQTGFLRAHADTTLIELIWNYWHEEGMVNQTMTAISRRFQNIKNGYKDPLLNFALDPLRPLNNILWGYIQDAQHRLTATRRNYEYTSEYDLFVLNTMKPGFNPADRRSKFLQSFHRLIYEATEYFVQSDNTTIRPDGFRLLNALRDTHRILAEGANNQFGDLPTVARIETLIEQWILSRPEVREFLGGRVMVPYEEPWMDRVDSMKALQGWDNTNISFYRDLAVYGEKIILGIRYGNWSQITRRDHATNWADAFRDAIQRYIHSYYTVTGIDLSAQNVNVNSEEKYLLPGVLIREKYIREKPMVRRY